MAHLSRRAGEKRIEVKTTKRIPRILPAMPIHVSYEPPHVSVSLEQSTGAPILHFRNVARRSADDQIELEAQGLVETFLEIKRPSEAVEFFSVAGFFRDAREEGDDHALTRLSWSDLKGWQEIVRILLSKGKIPNKYSETALSFSCDFDLPQELKELLNAASVGEQRWVDGIPHNVVLFQHPGRTEDGRTVIEAQIIVHSVLEAILAQSSIDRLNGIERRVCGLPDCNTLYEISSKHVRDYCSQACAHKASIRRKRARAKDMHLT